MVQFLSDSLIDFNEFNQFLVEDFLFLLEGNNLSIQLLQTFFQFFLVFQNGHLIFFFDSKLHLSDLECFLEVMGLSLQVLAPLLFLSPGLVALVQVSAEVLNLLLLLPEDLSEFVRGMSHVLQHVA